MNSYTIDTIAPFITDSYNIYEFHINSISADRSKIKYLNKKYEVYDLGKYSVIKIINLIKKLEISIMVFFTFQSDYDKLMYRICSFLEIKTILYDHGLVYGSDIPKGGIKLNLASILRKFHFLYCLNRMDYIDRDRQPNRFKDKLPKQIKFTHYILFSKNNYDYYKNHFSLTNNNTTLSGLSLFPTNAEFKTLKIQTRYRKILYLHQPFIKFGFTTINLKQEISFLNELNLLLKNQGFRLEVRLHPTTNQKEYTSNFLCSNISFMNNQYLEEQVASSYAVIGHWSTALAIALPLNIPLLIFEYPGIKPKFKTYYSLFQDVGRFYRTLDDLKNGIKKINNEVFIYDTNKIKYLIGENNTCEVNSQILKNVIEKHCR